MGHTLVFVYGTLKKGEQRSTILTDETFLGPAVLHGYKLYDLTWRGYPAITKGTANNSTFGELYSVSDRTLGIVDMLEGSLYSREEVTIETPRKKIRKAMTYVWNGVLEDLQDAKLVASGKWERRNKG